MLRLIVDEFWRLQRERVGERELADAQGVPHGQLPADHRDARRDRDAGAERRSSTGCRIERAADRSASASTPSRPTTSSASRAPTCSPIGCRSCSSATRRRSRRSCRASASATFETIEMDDLDLTAADFKRAARGAGGAAAAGEAGRERSARRQVAVCLRHDSAADRPRSAGTAVRRRAQDGASARRCSTASSPPRADSRRCARSRASRRSRRREMTTPAGHRSSATTTTYLQYPESRARRDQAARRDDRPGVRRHAWLGEGSQTACTTCRTRTIRDLEARLQARHGGAAARGARRSVRARLLPDVKDEAGQPHHALEFSALTASIRSSLYIDPETQPDREADLRRRRPGTAAHRRGVQRLPAGRRRPDRLHGDACAAAAAVLERQVTDIRINPPIDPALFTRPAS